MFVSPPKLRHKELCLSMSKLSWIKSSCGFQVFHLLLSFKFAGFQLNREMIVITLILITKSILLSGTPLWSTDLWKRPLWESSFVILTQMQLWRWRQFLGLSCFEHLFALYFVKQFVYHLSIAWNIIIFPFIFMFSFYIPVYLCEYDINSHMAALLNPLFFLTLHWEQTSQTRKSPVRPLLAHQGWSEDTLFYNTPGTPCQEPTEGLGFSVVVDICFSVWLIIDDSIDNLYPISVNHRGLVLKTPRWRKILADMTAYDSALMQNMAFENDWGERETESSKIIICVEWEGAALGVNVIVRSSLQMEFREISSKELSDVWGAWLGQDVPPGNDGTGDAFCLGSPLPPHPMPLVPMPSHSLHTETNTFMLT